MARGEGSSAGLELDAIAEEMLFLGGLAEMALLAGIRDRVEAGP